jgi:hypothetical protein
MNFIPLIEQFSRLSHGEIIEIKMKRKKMKKRKERKF